MTEPRHYPYVGPDVEDVSGKCLVCGEHWPCATERSRAAAKVQEART